MRLEWENKRLKSLLKAARLPQIWIDAYLNLADESERNDRQSIPESSPLTAGFSVNVSESLPDNLIGTISNIANEETSQANDNPAHVPPIPEDGEYDLFPWTDVPTSYDFSQTFPGSAEPPHDASPPSIQLERNPSSQPPAGTFCVDGGKCPSPGNSDSATTPCAVAYQMVLQYNIKGLDMVEIYIRLWNGCRKGRDGSRDCTVDNKVLFDVLDFIST